MKKKILLITAIILCLSILSAGSLAYETRVGTARNVITSGGVQVQVVEQQQLDGGLIDYPGTAVKILPETTVSKIVSVKSLQQPAWIRMRYIVTVQDETGKPLEIPQESLEKAIQITPDEANWVSSEGWWYYKTALGAGQVSKPLFETVTFSGAHMGNEYQGCTMKVHLDAQAVQQANNGSTVLKAAGWPETQEGGSEE